MSVIGSNILAGASGQGGYFLTKSIRFRSSASAYLNRTPASAGNRKTWTFSTWIKLGEIAASNGTIFAAGTTSGGSTRFYLRYTGSQFQTGFGSFNLDTTVAVYRDPSAWYHVVLAIDTTQATAANRLKIYVNGVQQTVTTSVNYSQNDDTAVNNTVTHSIARDHIIPGGYFDGYLTETYLIDGQALTPSSFGETSSTTGVWQPIRYTGTYGTNGFYLDFEDTSSVAALGYDAAGSNDWTVNNISLTSGSTYDSMKDVPTLTDADTANYCTWNPLAVGTNITTASGNLDATASSNSNAMLQGTFGITSGKWYWEVTLSSGTSAWAGSIIKSTAGLNYSSLSSGDAYSYSNDGSKYNGQTSTIYGNTYTTNDVISVAYNADTGKIWYAKNGTWQASGDPAAGTNEAYSSISGTYMPAALLNSATGIANFGQRPFSYTPPSGFVALNTFNLPIPTIGATASSQANDYFDVTTYTGTGSSQSITNSGSMQPDFVWIKGRSGATDHGLYDAVRGVQKQLESNNTDAETTETTGLTAFNSNGFTVGALAQLNTSSATYVGWQWKANGSGSSNTSGSITSTVSANTTAGFSVVIYTGTAANATVGHGLGVAPSMIITKNRDSSTAWWVYHASLGNTKYLVLNTTAAEVTSSSAWNNTSPTSTVFSLGAANPSNANQDVAYCFAQVAGYSAFGSYTGNGSTDGTFIYTGFRPKWLMIKVTNTTDNWYLIDTVRQTYNVIGSTLSPNLSNAEFDLTIADMLSNGFKIRNSASVLNGNGNTVIYAAFAETPFKYSLGR